MNVLLIDNELFFAKSVLRRLEREGHCGVIRDSLRSGRDSFKNMAPDLVLLAVRQPDGNGLDLLRELRQQAGMWQLPIIMMVADGELEAAVSAMQLGANDYLKKTGDLDELVLTLTRVIQRQELNQQLDYSWLRESQGIEPVTMIGDSPVMQQLRQRVDQIAALVDKSEQGQPVLLIRGETGTGKGTLARFYHQQASWHDRPYIHVDCASLPPNLVEAKLFGYAQGAFTHAHQAKPGLIEAAEDGTLFLDEVGELPLELQAKLLNVLEHRKVRRLGSIREYPVLAHIVVATNHDLKNRVAEGRFRSDLYFRLKMLEIILPPLRERQADIAALLAYFAQATARRYGIVQPVVSPDAETVLKRYHWPGNVRELQHVIERAVMNCRQGQIGTEHLLLEQQISASGSQCTLDELSQMTLEQVEKYLLERALQRTNENVSGAARELGLTRMAMRYRMDKYGL